MAMNSGNPPREASLDVLFVMAAIAIYKECGVIEALAYLHKQGYTPDEAVEIIALYDKYCDLCRTGQKMVLWNSPKGKPH